MNRIRITHPTSPLQPANESQGGSRARTQPPHPSRLPTPLNDNPTPSHLVNSPHPPMHPHASTRPARTHPPTSPSLHTSVQPPPASPPMYTLMQHQPTASRRNSSCGKHRVRPHSNGSSSRPAPPPPPSDVEDDLCQGIGVCDEYVSAVPAQTQKQQPQHYTESQPAHHHPLVDPPQHEPLPHKHSRASKRVSSSRGGVSAGGAAIGSRSPTHTRASEFSRSLGLGGGSGDGCSGSGGGSSGSGGSSGGGRGFPHWPATVHMNETKESKGVGHVQQPRQGSRKWSLDGR